jgi:hypothetical protein
LSESRYGPVIAENCALSVGKDGRSYFERCHFQDVKAKKCIIGFPIFKDCVFKNVRSDFLRCYGALFLQCKLEGHVNGLTFGICPEREPIDEATKSRIAAENADFLKSAKYCLDIRNSILVDCAFEGTSIARRVIFEKGQCAIYRAENLAEKMLKLRDYAKSVKDRSIQMALLSPIVSPGEEIQLVSMETCGTTERIDELKNILHKGGVELIDQPLVSATS